MTTDKKYHDVTKHRITHTARTALHYVLRLEVNGG